MRYLLACGFASMLWFLAITILAGNGVELPWPAFPLGGVAVVLFGHLVEQMGRRGQ